MCEVCDKSHFALDTLWQLISTPEICDLFYRNFSDADDEAKAIALKLIKRARTEDPEAVDDLRGAFLAHMYMTWLIDCRCAPMLAAQGMSHMISTALVARLSGKKTKHGKENG